MDLRSIGFSNPLTNFEPNHYSQIDIERSHPSGISQLSATGKSVLSNLFRDPLAFSRAYSAAKRIKAHADTLSSQQGIQALAMVSGLVNLAHAGFDLSLPILVWPIQLNRRTDDFEIIIDGPPVVNPALVDALAKAASVRLDAKALLSNLDASGDLLPIALMRNLNEQVGNRADFEVSRIVVVGNFATSVVNLVNDFSQDDTPLLRQLVGYELREEPAISLTPPILVADADSTQERIVARALAGDSFAVETLPGCGYTQTMVNTIAALSHAGKSVLVLAPRRQTLSELTDRFSSLGLGGIAVRTSDTWLDVISAISRHEKARPSNMDVARVRYEAALAEMESYFNLLVKEDSKVGITLTEALEALAKLSILPHAPRSTARIPNHKLLNLRERQGALSLLLQAFDLGEFDYAPEETLWFGARFESQDQAETAKTEVRRLVEVTFPNLREQMENFTSRVGFKPAQSVEDWGVYLRLFLGIRDSLARFVPDVFGRPLDDLITATGPRHASEKMSGSNRRRLKKVAKEYVRPGMAVNDIHEALMAVREQREAWSRYCVSGANPEVPNGINDAMVIYQSLLADLNSLQLHLDNAEDAPILMRMNLEELQTSLVAMNTDARPLERLAEKNEVRAQLRELGLGDLARDLAKLKCAREHIAVELELSWWQSILEYLIARDSRVMSYSREQIEKLETDFCDAAADLVKCGAAEIANRDAETWRELLQQHVSQSASLKAVLKTGKATLRSIAEAAPNFAQLLTRVVLASPYELAQQLHPIHKFDVVIVADAAGTTLAQNLSGIRRANQLIAFGDDAIASPDGFEIEVQEFEPRKDEPAKSVFSLVRAAFGTEVLRVSWRPNGQTLGSLINREFYQNRIHFAPTPSELMGRRTFGVEHLRSGIGVHSAGKSVESPDAEVDRVVELVMSHVMNWPSESLLVATPSKNHALRVEAALNIKRKASSEFDEWFDSHGREKFEITDLATLSHRVADRIIFSIGFGLGSDALAPLEMGDLTHPSGRRFLANLLVSARNRIDIVTCFEAPQVDHLREHDVHRLLSEILRGDHLPESFESDPDPLLEDLALRLRKLGARVVENFGGTLRLVANYSNTSVVIYPDWSLDGESLNDKLRLRPALLKGMGWKVLRVHAFELFADPEALAIRIAETLGMEVTKRPQPLFDVKTFDETDEAWGDRSTDNDQRLRNEKPPHWG